MRIRILIQNQATQRFFTGDGEWTENQAEARVFDSGPTAVAAAVRNRLMEVGMLYLFGDPSLNFKVSIS